jgi:hypothetical protein
VQLVPMLARLADSPRAAGLDWQQSTAWSLPWQRIAELFFPRFFGNASQPELALYFGWGIHDRDYPYLVWIGVGLPLLLLSLASWTRRDSPERATWAVMSLAGLFFALGRHNPLYHWAWSYLPGVDSCAARRSSCCHLDRGGFRRGTGLAAAARSARAGRSAESSRPPPGVRRRAAGSARCTPRRARCRPYAPRLPRAAAHRLVCADAGLPLLGARSSGFALSP